MIAFESVEFWKALKVLIEEKEIVIDRPKGRPHPTYTELIYPLDYGYLEGTRAGDGEGIDIWIGSQQGGALTGILCTYDTIEGDTEIKLLLECNASEVDLIQHFMPAFMRWLYIPIPEEYS